MRAFEHDAVAQRGDRAAVGIGIGLSVEIRHGVRLTIRPEAPPPPAT
jgi:predicted NBD/HSP70 family sugar kinase